MPNIIQNFHFLRPWLLTLLIPAAGLLWYALQRENSRSGMQDLIADHLLEHLVVGGKDVKKIRPVYLLAAFWIIGIMALSGPTWDKEPSPFIEDTAGLVIALKVTPTMLAQDIQPSRLERATQKIHDLLKLRPGSKTALIAYSGSAHLTMPLTIDPKIIDMFSQALTPEIMPEKGDAVAKALELGASLLDKAEIPGSILLIADQVEKNQLKEIRAFREKSGISVHIYAIAANRGITVPPGSPPAPALNMEALKKAAAAAGASLTIVSPDDRDVLKLADRIKTTLSATKQNQGDRWQDAGYWLLPILLILGLFFFRHGWMVVYE
ncbi:VWA domain-containing protein [bacterium]|nr:VWA domain-containing protein [bacterium]